MFKHNQVMDLKTITALLFCIAILTLPSSVNCTGKTFSDTQVNDKKLIITQIRNNY